MAEAEQGAALLDKETLITLTSDIVAAHVSNNSVGMESVAELIATTYQALAALGTEPAAEIKPEPAVSVRASIKKDHIVCLDCGKKMKMLKRHISTEHNMTIDEYRTRWGLGADYPIVAPDYAEVRRGLAKKIGLGRKPGESPKKAAAKAAAPSKTAAKPKAAVKPKAAASKGPAAKTSAKKTAAPQKAAAKPAAKKSAAAKAPAKRTPAAKPAPGAKPAAKKPASKKSAVKKAPAAKPAKK